MHGRDLIAVYLLSVVFTATACSDGEGPVAPKGPNEIVARFTHSAPNGYAAGEAILFDGSSSTTAFFRIVEFRWDWGDGSEPETFDAPTASHTFAGSCDPEVTLTVRDQAGRRASTRSSLVISAHGSAPVARFTYEAPDGWQPGSELFFDASGSSDPDGDELSYAWDWGDGYVSGPQLSPTSSHVFAFEGETEITLTVNDGTGWQTVSERLRLSFGYPLERRIVGWMPYPPDPVLYDFALSGDYAYMACGFYAVQVVDIRDPGNPTLERIFYDAKGTSISISGHHAIIGGYAAYSPHSLYILDISDPGNPVLVTRYESGSFYPEDIIWIGDYAYVTDSKTVRILDLSVPDNPVETAVIERDGYRGATAVEGDFMYVVASADLGIYDISDPAQPIAVGSCVLPVDWIEDLLVDGAYLYVPWNPNNPTKPDKLLVYDVSDPANPVAIGECDAFNAESIAKSGDTIIVGHKSLDFIDASDPASPVVIGFGAVPAEPSELVIRGDLLFANGGGFAVVDISDLRSPMAVATLEANELGGLTEGTDIEVIGNYAYMSTDPPGLKIIDLRDPRNPAVPGGLTVGGETSRIAVSGERVYLVDNTYGLLVVDASDRANPVLAGRIEVVGARDVAVSGGYAFVAGSGHNSLAVVDASDPSNMTIVASLVLFTQGECIEIEGNYAYLSGYESDTQGWSVYTVDISNPRQPSALGSVELAQGSPKLCTVSSLGISGDYLCALTCYGRPSSLKVVDITDPASPVVVGAATANYSADDMEVFGYRAYLADSLTDLTVIDFSDPFKPMMSGHAEAPGYAGCIGVESNIACVVGEDYDGISLTVIELW